MYFTSYKFLLSSTLFFCRKTNTCFFINKRHGVYRERLEDIYIYIFKGKVRAKFLLVSASLWHYFELSHRVPLELNKYDQNLTPSTRQTIWLYIHNRTKTRTAEESKWITTPATEGAPTSIGLLVNTMGGGEGGMKKTITPIHFLRPNTVDCGCHVSV